MLSVRQYAVALAMVATATTNGLIDAAPSDDYSADMLALVNKERALAGVPALCMNKKLQAAAQRHSNDMAEKNFMGHGGSDGSTVSQRIAEAGYGWDAVAENVAAGQENVTTVMQSWMDSPGHRENILNREYTMFGTAYSYNQATSYKYFWTQDFGSSSTETCDGGNPPTPVTPVTPVPAIPVPPPASPVATPVYKVPAPTTPLPSTSPKDCESYF
ncbi:hypothetical protein PsorP6_003192 [Peronosclerospora sorghi]|uniref:Uncharacterized protein n=1 Tax=Peronosclerospora sorghi TaxID=230839 RepID=A0ACC0VKH7_9STRA|nr:hypothetical protein PsorP6_003192 [Peronosclerospora sorghi]